MGNQEGELKSQAKIEGLLKAIFGEEMGEKVLAEVNLDTPNESNEQVLESTDEIREFDPISIVISNGNATANISIAFVEEDGDSMGISLEMVKSREASLVTPSDYAVANISDYTLTQLRDLFRNLN